MKRTARAALVALTAAAATVLASCTPSANANEVDAARRALRSAGVNVTAEITCEETSHTETAQFSEWALTCRHRNDIAYVVAKYPPGHKFASLVTGVNNKGNMVLQGCHYAKVGEQWRHMKCS